MNFVRISLPLTVFVSLFSFLIYFYNGVELIFNAVFLSSVHPLDSLTERHQSIPFQILTSLLYSILVTKVCSLKCFEL